VLDGVEGADDVEGRLERRRLQEPLDDGDAGASPRKPQALDEEIHTDDLPAGSDPRQGAEDVTRPATDLEDAIAGRELAYELLEQRGDGPIPRPEPEVTILDRRQRGEEFLLVAD